MRLSPVLCRIAGATSSTFEVIVVISTEAVAAIAPAYKAGASIPAIRILCEDGMHDALKEFKAYYSVSTKLIKEVSKEDLAEVARVLALQLADYQHRFGKIPNRDLLGLLGIVKISEEQAKLLRDGMEILIGHLGAIQGEQEDNSRVH